MSATQQPNAVVAEGGLSVPIEEVAARLASRTASRTEADIQSDVRTLLLYGGLELDAPQMVNLEVQTDDGTRRRIDIEAGFTVFEVKKDLRVGNVRHDALQQLAGYVRSQTDRLGQRYVGVLTDGAEWTLCHLRPDGMLTEVSQHTLDPSAADADALRNWLGAVLSTQSAVRPTPIEIERRLGASSPAFRLDYADLQGLYDLCRENPEVGLKRQLWAKLLTTAYGVNFDDSDDTLFVEHTYLVLVAEMIAHAVVGLDPATTDPKDLATGRRFVEREVYGVVEADFFDWPLQAPGGEQFLRTLARRIGRFEWAGVEHDVLKSLYESVIGSEQRHALGEYYTPDWLAEAAVGQVLDTPLTQRVLDPSCGSGTFVFHAIRRYLAAAERDGVPNAEAVQGVTEHVFGVDIHPVAVTLARVTYLLGIGLERLRDRGALTIPIYMGDSLQWGYEETLLSDGSLVLSTSDGLELVPRELKFPAGVIADAATFDRLILELADKATSRERGTPTPAIRGILNRYGLSAQDKDTVTESFRVMCDLHDHHRNHIWSYYIRNIARPVWLSRPENRCDVVLGNPPWLSYRYMTSTMRQDFRSGSEERGLWAGSELATSQDLSAYFVARAVELYLAEGGAFAFIMPNATLSRPHFAGFRSGYWPTHADDTAVSFSQPWDLVDVRPHPFPMPCAAVFGHRAASPRAMGDIAVAYHGRIPGDAEGWSDARSALDAEERGIVRPAGSLSPYASVFRQGATVTPRVLLTVECDERSDLLSDRAGYVSVRSLRTRQEKSPWRDLEGLRGAVEEQFVHPLQLGITIAPFRCLASIEAVIPWVDGQLLDGDNEILDEYPGLARWWREAERLWEQHASSGMTLRERLDYQRLLTIQFPLAEHRVVYNRSGTRLIGAYVVPQRSVIDTKLYWGAVASRVEADYLCAVLNSAVMTELVNPLQGRGQFGPRDFYKLPFNVPIPRFDPQDDSHVKLGQLGAESARVAHGVSEQECGTYQRARNAIRRALDETGIVSDINDLVTELVLA